MVENAFLLYLEEDRAVKGRKILFPAFRTSCLNSSAQSLMILKFWAIKRLWTVMIAVVPLIGLLSKRQNRQYVCLELVCNKSIGGEKLPQGKTT